RLYYNRFPGRMQGKVVFFPYPLYFRAELCAENTEIFILLFLSGPAYIIIGSNKSGPAALRQAPKRGNSGSNGGRNSRSPALYRQEGGRGPESEAAMVNKVRVNIAGAQYAFATTDSEKYITSLADKLDRDITKLMEANPSLPVTKAAVFCAMDYLDEYQKSTGSAENMRGQIQDYIADAARARTAEDKLRAENEALRREAAALREQLDRLRRHQEKEKE